MINCLIVDDEPLARDVIKAHLTKVPKWNVVTTCINAEEAYEALLNYNIDVLFLDIEMPVITGVEFLQSLKNPPLIIFTTAYSKYALKGFDLNVIDYLLKPISFSRFIQAIEKVNLKLSKTKILQEKSTKENTYFFVKHDGKLIKIIFSEIIYIKAEQEYSCVYTTKKKLLISMHLKLLEDILPTKLFTRMHRSYIVPQEKVTSIYGNTLKINDTIQLPIGNKYKEKLLQKLAIK